MKNGGRRMSSEQDGGMGRLVTEKQASQRMSVSVALLRKWRRMGGGPPYCKLGSLVRYSEADLMVFIEQSRVEAA
jgi:hypothetical protein